MTFSQKSTLPQRADMAARSFRSKVGLQYVPLPRDISAKCGGWLTKSDSKSVAYENRTKSAQSGGLETNGPRERISGLDGPRSAEVYARSPRLLAISARQNPAENVGRGRTGGGRGTGIQRSSLIGLSCASPSKHSPSAKIRQAGFTLRSAVGAGPPQGGVRNGNRCINLLESVLVTNHGGSDRPLDDVTRPYVLPDVSAETESPV